MEDDEIPLIEIQDFVIGDQGCSYTSVANVLNPDESDALVKNWQRVARQMKIPAGTMNKLKHNLRLDGSSMWDIYYSMLEKWHMEQSNNATVLALVKILQDVGIRDKADKLRDTFLPFVNSPLKKHKDPRKPFDRIALCLFSIFATLWIFAVILMRFPLWSIFQPKYLNTIPDVPTFYVPRSIIPRNKISLSIFQEDLTNDILVFQGITRARVKMLTNNGLVDTFENQIIEDVVTAHYITNLTKISDFCDINRKIDNRSLHFLIYDENLDSLHWVQSIGNLTLIQTHLTKDNEQSEEYLLELFKNPLDVPQVHLNLNKMCFTRNYSQTTLKPIIISGESGSGKSLFLASLGSKLYTFNEDLTTFIIAFPQLVDDIRNLKKFGADIRDRIIYAVSNQTCRNRKCTADLLIKFKSHSTRFVLLIDDFDQLDNSQILDAEPILYEINNWINTQVIISTTPHLLPILEQILGTVGQKIQPLSFSDQFHILFQFWLDKKPYIDVKRLKYFTTNCLSFIHEELKDNTTSKQLGGLAIQTMLIANIYQTDALKYADTNNIIDKDAQPVFKPISIIQLYSEMIEGRINLHASKTNSNIELLWGAHSTQALQITFPKLKIRSNLSNTTTQQLLNIGLVTTAKNKGLKFLHKTITNYFIAWWILNCDNTQDLYSAVIVQLFETTPTQIPLNILGNQNNLTLTKFKYEMIVYFLSLMMRLPEYKNSKLQIPIVNRQDAALAAVKGNFGNVLHAILLSGKNTNNVITNELLVLSVIYSDEQVVNFLIQYYQNRTSVDISNVVVSKTQVPPINLLHLAVIRGDYKIFQIVSSVVNTNFSGQFILHACVGFEFSTKSASIVAEKKEIIESLVSQNRSILKERADIYNMHGTPILNCMYPKLLIYLLEIGADAFDIAKYDNVTILHVAARKFDNVQFYYVVKQMHRMNFLYENLVNAEDIEGETPLQKHIANREPLHETLEIFYTSRANLNATNNFNDTILSTAIRSKHSISCIKLIMGYNVITNNHNLPEKTLVRLAIKQGHLRAVNFLVNEKGFNVNEKDPEDFLTPLYIAVQNDWHGGKTEVVEVLLIAKANSNTVNGITNETALHVAAKDGWISTILVLIRYGADPFVIDSLGNTALHFALIRRKWMENGIPDEFEIVRYLIEEKQLEVNRKNGNDQTALEQALEEGKDCKAFLHLKTYMYLADKEGIFEPILATAVLERMVGLDCSPTENHLSDEEYNGGLDQIIKLGGDFNRLNQHEMTFIHQAVKNKCIKGLKYMVKQGVDVFRKDDLGKTAMDYALKIINSNIRGKIIDVLESVVEKQTK